MARISILFCLFPLIAKPQDTTWIVNSQKVYYDTSRVEIDSTMLVKGIREGRCSRYQYARSGQRKLVSETSFLHDKPVFTRCCTVSEAVQSCTELKYDIHGHITEDSYIAGGHTLWRNYNYKRHSRKAKHYHQNGKLSGRGRQREYNIEEGCDAGAPVYGNSGIWLYYNERGRFSLRKTIAGMFTDAAERRRTKKYAELE